MNRHPNASIAQVGTWVAVIVIYAAGIFGLDAPDEVDAAFTGLLISAILFAGRRRPAGRRER